MPNKLELMLRKAGRELADYQIARLFKVPEEMTQTPVDFFGYTADGRAILVEAKMVNRSGLPVGKSPGLLPHQWCELMDANRANCIALVCWARNGICATISMDMAIDLSRDRKSIPWKGIDERYMHTMAGPTAHLGLLEPWLRRATQPC